MVLTNRRERLRVQTGQAAARFFEARDAAAGQEPRPGATFVGIATRAFPVEWLVIEQDPEDARRLLVVAVDDNPLVGSCDVEVPSRADGSFACIRCRQGTWLSREALAPELCTGVLGSEMIDRVRRKRADIEAGNLSASFLEQEVDSDPEYRGWMEMLGAAQAALAGQRRIPETKLAEVITHPKARWRPASRLYGLAASVLLVVSMGLSGGLVRQRSQIGDLERDRRQLDQSRQDLVTRTEEQQGILAGYRRQIEGLDLLRDQGEQKLAALEHRLEEAQFQEPQINLPLAFLTREEALRGEGYPLRVPASARRIALVLEVVDPQDYPSYRLQISAQETSREVSREVWRSDRLKRTGGSLVSLDLPRSTFTTGEYQLRIYGLSSGQAKLLEAYSLSIELE